MPPKYWFNTDPIRLVREYELVHSAYPEFQLSMKDGLLVWEGQTSDTPPGVDSPPLFFRVEYPSGFPIAAIKVCPLSPNYHLKNGDTRGIAGRTGGCAS